MANIERKLASVRKVTEIRPIPDADAIECAIVGGGWPVVVKKGEFQAGDLAIYFEIDSWIPHELAPFLSKGKEPREYNGVKGERLKTVRLRGQVSQGLLLRFSDISPSFYVVSLAEPYGGRGSLRVDECVWQEGEDFTLEFGIQKWEATVPACLAGQVRGNFPSFLVKSDQERCQNIVRKIFEEHKEETYEVSLKLDGSSCTIYARDGDSGVCSRNLDLKETEGNSFWKAAREQGVIDALLTYNKETGRNIALQMELCGEGIQENQEGIKGQRLFLFDVFDIDTQTYMKPGQRLVFLDEVLTELGAKLEHTPIIDLRTYVAGRFANLDELLAYADGPSMNPKVKREGVVFKSYDSAFSFKAISNEWLLWKGKKG
jgi:RNA ligase (TIGR02306 family)